MNIDYLENSSILIECIEKIEQLEEEKKDISSSISDIFKALEVQGFNKSIVKELMKLKKMGSTERQQREILLEKYKKALGMSEDAF